MFNDGSGMNHRLESDGSDPLIKRVSLHFRPTPVKIQAVRAAATAPSPIGFRAPIG